MKNHNTYIPFFLLLLLGAATMACSISLLSESGSDSGQDETQMAEDVNATLTSVFETEAAMIPPTSPATDTPIPTDTLIPTDTPIPTDTSIPTDIPTPTIEGPWVGKFTFGTGSENNQAVNPGTVFKKGITKIYAVFPYSGMKDGDRITVYWSVNGEEWVNALRRWEWGPSGTLSWYIYYEEKNQSLPIGNWVFNLYLGNKLMQTGKFQIVQ